MNPVPAPIKLLPAVSPSAAVKFVRRCWCVALIALSASGCGYRPGRISPGFDPGIKSIAIPIFENVSSEPLIETLLTEAVREEFIDDGRLEVVPVERAELILRGKITGYGTRTLAFDDTDRASARRVVMSVKVSVVERSSGKELVFFNLRARSEYAVHKKLSALEKAKESAERRGFRELAEELVELLFSGL